MRFQMKNTVKILYRYVIQNMELLKGFKEGKVSRKEL
jgi:hypothetical protein